MQLRQQNLQYRPLQQTTEANNPFSAVDDAGPRYCNSPCSTPEYHLLAFRDRYALVEPYCIWVQLYTQHHNTVKIDTGAKLIFNYEFIQPSFDTLSSIKDLFPHTCRAVARDCISFCLTFPHKTGRKSCSCVEFLTFQFERMSPCWRLRVGCLLSCFQVCNDESILKNAFNFLWIRGNSVQSSIGFRRVNACSSRNGNPKEDGGE